MTYSIYDVTTDIGALTGHTAGAAAFTDLGSGLVYGSTSFAATTGSSQQLVIDLSGGLNDINAALGGLFALGGDSSLVSNQGFLWSSSFLGPAAHDLLQRLLIVASSVPIRLAFLAPGGTTSFERI